MIDEMFTTAPDVMSGTAALVSACAVDTLKWKAFSRKSVSVSRNGRG
jgi:hypothetical protein